MYSCSDFADDIAEALGVNCAGMEDMPEEQFEACLNKIQAMKAENAKLANAMLSFRALEKSHRQLQAALQGLLDWEKRLGGWEGPEWKAARKAIRSLK